MDTPGAGGHPNTAACRNVAADGAIASPYLHEAAFTGIIDEAAIYDRALTPAEVAAYYAATK